MKYQCRHKSIWGKRCTKGTIRGKDYCSEHSKPNYSQTYSIGKTLFSPVEKEKIDYNTYIQSDAWKIRAGLERKKNPNCSLCNGKGLLHVHHRTYINLGNERDGDLIVLCDDCHKLFHDNYTYSTLGYFIKK